MCPKLSSALLYNINVDKMCPSFHSSRFCTSLRFFLNQRDYIIESTHTSDLIFIALSSSTLSSPHRHRCARDYLAAACDPNFHFVSCRQCDLLAQFFFVEIILKIKTIQTTFTDYVLTVNHYEMIY